MTDTTSPAPAESTFSSDPDGLREAVAAQRQARVAEVNAAPLCRRPETAEGTAMSEVRQLRPFTPGNAPRNGGVAGRKSRISARSLKVIDALLTDFAEHGPAAVQIMRIERPAEYVRTAMDVASRMVRAEHGGTALVSISINRFFAEEPTVTIDGASDDKPAV